MAGGSGSASDVAGSLPAPERLFDAVAGASDDAIFTVDGRGVVGRWSTPCERLFGQQRTAVVGRAVEVLVAEHARPEWREALARVVAGERVVHLETEGRRPDGLPMPLLVTLAPLAGASGEPVTVVVARDVTEQRLAQAALAEVERRLEEGEALTHVGSWLWDVRTGTVQWSTEFHRIHGVDPLDFGGTLESHLALVDPEDRGRVAAAFDRAARSGQALEESYRIHRPDGSLRSVQVRARAAVGSSGTVLGLRGVGQDVTEQRDGISGEGPASRDRRGA